MNLSTVTKKMMRILFSRRALTNLQLSNNMPEKKPDSHKKNIILQRKQVKLLMMFQFGLNG